MKKIKNNPGFGGKKIKITFEETFETKIKSKKGGNIPPLPPFCARRPCPEWLAWPNASLSIHGTTTPKNLVSQIAFGKRFANLWFVFAKLKFAGANFKTRPHLNFCEIYFCCAKTVNAFFGVVVPWMERSRTTGAHPPPPSKEGEIEPTPYPLPTGGGKQKQKRKTNCKD